MSAGRTIRPILLGARPYLLIELDLAYGEGDVLYGGTPEELEQLLDCAKRTARALKKEIKAERKAKKK